MSDDLIIQVLLILFGSGGFITAFLTFKQTARKDQLEELKTIIEAVQEENTRLRQRLLAVEEKNTALEVELRLWRNHANDMRRIIVQSGGCPPDFPERN